MIFFQFLQSCFFSNASRHDKPSRWNVQTVWLSEPRKKESLSVFASICLNLWPQSLCFFLSLSLWPENTSGFERKGNSLERLQLFLSSCLTFRHTFPACHHCIPSLLKHKTRWLVHFNFWIVSFPHLCRLPLLSSFIFICLIYPLPSQHVFRIGLSDGNGFLSPSVHFAVL